MTFLDGDGGGRRRRHFNRRMRATKEQDLSDSEGVSYSRLQAACTHAGRWRVGGAFWILHQLLTTVIRCSNPIARRSTPATSIM